MATMLQGSDKIQFITILKVQSRGKSLPWLNSSLALNSTIVWKLWITMIKNLICNHPRNSISGKILARIEFKSLDQKLFIRDFQSTWMYSKRLLKMLFTEQPTCKFYSRFYEMVEWVNLIKKFPIHPPRPSAKYSYITLKLVSVI